MNYPNLRMRCIARTAILATCVILPLLLTGCGKNDNMQPVKGKVNVVTTFYPLYYFANEIGGEDAHVVNLVPAGVEPHEWTPKSQDLKTASEAQIFMYNGAGLEGWTADFLDGLNKKDSRLTVAASDGIPLIEDGGQTQHDAHGLDVDPHTWVSPKSALLMAQNIHNAFVKADPAHRQNYDSRYAVLKDKITALDARFSSGLAKDKGRDIVVSHQAFGYLCRDYGLKQTALMGLSPEAEPRSQDIVNVIQFVKQHNIRAIFFEELVSTRLTETVANETGAEMLVLNPLEGLTPEQDKAGENYITLMERNLQNLQKALQ